MKQNPMRYFAAVGDDLSVSFVQSGIKEEDTPENYHEIGKSQYDKFMEDPEKFRGYSWKDDKVVYTKPPDPPAAPTPPPDQAHRLTEIEGILEQMERRLKSVEQRKERTSGARS